MSVRLFMTPRSLADAGLCVGGIARVLRDAKLATKIQASKIRSGRRAPETPKIPFTVANLLKMAKYNREDVLDHISEYTDVKYKLSKEEVKEANQAIVNEFIKAIKKKPFVNNASLGYDCEIEIDSHNFMMDDLYDKALIPIEEKFVKRVISDFVQYVHKNISKDHSRFPFISHIERS